LESILTPAALTLTQLFIVAFLVEAIVENFKWVLEGEFLKERVLALVVSLAVTLLTGLDLFHFAGIPLTLPLVGSIFSGLIMARGSNYLHDLVAKLGKS
jgi:hypothetical protein